MNEKQFLESSKKHAESYNIKLNPDAKLVKSLLKYLAAGIIIGGILPSILHPLNITVFASTTDILTHLISILIAVSISLIIYKIKNKQDKK